MEEAVIEYLKAKCDICGKEFENSADEIKIQRNIKDNKMYCMNCAVLKVEEVEKEETVVVQPKLTAKIVSDIFLDCIIKASEMDQVTRKTKIDSVAVEGIVAFYLLSKERVEKHRQEIIDALSELPDQFMKTKGAGWTFLNMCVDKNGRQWSSLHRVMEQLVCLGVAIGKVVFCLPRPVWNKLPGSVPYIQVDL